MALFTADIAFAGFTAGTALMIEGAALWIRVLLIMAAVAATATGLAKLSAAHQARASRTPNADAHPH